MTSTPIQKILIIGAGPIRIGQTGAYDDAACRACEVFKSAGIQTVMVHCDPSALAADADMADRTYLVPLSVEAMTEILLRERPTAIFPSVGGKTALRLAADLAQSGFLKENNIGLLGVTENSLALAHDPAAFFAAAEDQGLSVPKGEIADSIADAASLAEKTGYPVFVRCIEPDLTVRNGIAFNVEELRQLSSSGRLPSDATGRVRIESALSGYLEVEVALLRDAENGVQMVAMAENLDPVGIHSGDSLAVVPPMTIDEPIRHRIASAAVKLAETTGVTGVLHLKFAVSSTSGEILVIAVDSGYSRMTGFLAKAFDLPLAAIHARLSLGISMAHALNGDSRRIATAMTGSTVAVRLPRWEFERFPGESAKLDSRMKSTGAVMGLGDTFLQALSNAERAGAPYPSKGKQLPDLNELDADMLLHRLVSPSPQRLPLIHAALKKGAAADAIAEVTGIAVGWIRLLAERADLEREVTLAGGESFSSEIAQRVAGGGICPVRLASLLSITVDEATDLFARANVTFAARPTAGGEPAHIWTHTPIVGNHSHGAPLGKSVLVVAPASGRIGQSIELDHCCVHAARALKAVGRKVVMTSANPASACGPGDADRTHVVPLTVVDLKAVCQTEIPDGVVLQFGGYKAMTMAEELNAVGFPVLGTAPESTALCQDRMRFSQLLTDLGIPHRQIGTADSPDKAMDLAEAIGYPLMVTARTDLQGRRQTLIMDARMLEQHVMEVEVSTDRPLLLEQFLEYAIEVEADALCDGQAVYVPTVMEHIELAGVHPGDAAVVVPPYSTPPRHIDTITAMIEKIALQLNVKGLLNTRFAVLNDTVYLLEVRPWACRTLPLVSKICNVPMAQRAVEIMLGMTLDEMDLPRRILPHYGIRASVFPFDTFTETDPMLGPRMRSTGQVMAMADVFGMAYFTSQEAAGPALPLGGNVLITVTDADKPSILEPARLFNEMGFGIQATRGTHAFLKKNGIEAQLVKKLGFGRPDLVDGIKTGDVSLVVNTPSGSQSQQDDAYIRKTAIRYRIPDVTTPAAALAAAKGIAARKRGQDALCTLQSYVRAIK
ncbi:carbamoyl phosphate synthase large subunit [Desulfosarcina ovata subsp. sediminis]|uniref:Carbamoyl phosphate synthase large subunit n=1 Tax=Desulfosarcina ovata subsp. sediminis TaxID=885957 RepID=A0A5K7ZP36_9BACT|nr:carbamoyl-phosphate synthase large subunit [Desulfosarcina ovata]BBO80550.1 carbamoyl phosphate synthase large subunit [Desulfosarcina ovata subsp. sediminis]